jgi:hypothetical protein
MELSKIPVSNFMNLNLSDHIAMRKWVAEGALHWLIFLSFGPLFRLSS